LRHINTEYVAKYLFIVSALETYVNAYTCVVANADIYARFSSLKTSAIELKF